ncbi:hypothetical protein BD769DRAFT_1776608 [Suillus cothurnatus]|nr:hypothetical protein BD769DRAFT_1776608 [Suillus cothurnatus]
MLANARRGITHLQWAKRTIEGPGILATCVKGKEKGTVGELYDLFESLAADMWLIEGHDSSANDRYRGSDAEENEHDLETQITKEVAALKRPKVEKHSNSTPYVVEPLLRTVLKRTPKGLRRLARHYIVELRVRNHNTLTRMKIIQEVAKCMPSNYTVDLDDPDVFILVEVFKSTFGMNIVEDYYRFQKFNVIELANAHNEPERIEKGAGRIQDKKQDDNDNGTA